MICWGFVGSTPTWSNFSYYKTTALNWACPRSLSDKVQMQLNFKGSKFARIMRSFEEIGCECHSEVLVTSCGTCNQAHLILNVLCFGWISYIDCRSCYCSCIYRVSDHQLPWTLPTTIEQNPIRIIFSKSLGFQKCLWKAAWSLESGEIHVWSHPRQLVSLGISWWVLILVRSYRLYTFPASCL